MTLDLDKLAALAAAMTPGEWFAERFDDDAGRINWQLESPLARTIIGSVDELDDKRARHDAAGLVALRNAADELLRLARVGQAYVAWRSRGFTGLADPEAFPALAAAYRAATEGR